MPKISQLLTEVPVLLSTLSYHQERGERTQMGGEAQGQMARPHPGLLSID